MPVAKIAESFGYAAIAEDRNRCIIGGVVIIRHRRQLQHAQKWTAEPSLTK
jgi:hypothetical protein